MTVHDFFFETPYHLTKVCLKKGDILPLNVQNPFILFIPQEGVNLSFEREKGKIRKREEMIFLPSGLSCVLSTEKEVELHFFYISDPFTLYFRHIAPAFDKEVTLPKELFHSLPLHSIMKSFIQSLTRYQKDGLLSEELLKIKTAELFTMLKLLHSEKELKQFFAPSLSPKHHFKLIVLSSYRKIKTVEEFSGKLGISPSTFNRLFQKTFGISPYKWMIQKKIDMLSDSIIHSPESLKQIAYNNGFSSLSQMIDFCKKHTGMTPGEIRKNKGVQPIMN